MDYKRFISYLYSYQGEEKGVNVGYIRCEQRQGYIRFTLSMNDPQGIEDGKYRIYLYRIAEDRIPVGYILDEVVLHDHVIELKSQTGSKNVWNTGRQLQEFDGVIIMYDPAHMYMSQWSDAETLLSRFIPWQEWESARKQKRENSASENVIREKEKTDGGEEHARKESEGEGGKQKGDEHGEAMSEDQTVEFAAEINVDRAEGMIGQGYEKEISGQKQPEGAGEQANVEIADKQERLSESKSEDTITGTETAPSRPSISPLTIKLMENRPKLPDFENHEIYDCVRIIPNDIGMLEMENWRLGVNSFLTHGFYNYKYLLLGKLRFQDGVVKAVLGVPGIYDSKEQYIAKIFGFEVFVPLKHTNIKTGNFGYWITELT